MNAFGTKRIESNRIIRFILLENYFFFFLIEDRIVLHAITCSTTIEKTVNRSNEKQDFFFYLTIVVGYGSIPKHIISVLPHSHELIAHPLRFSFFTIISYTSDSHHFSQTSGERRKFRSPSRQRHSYVKLCGGREIRN